MKSMLNAPGAVFRSYLCAFLRRGSGHPLTFRKRGGFTSFALLPNKGPALCSALGRIRSVLLPAILLYAGLGLHAQEDGGKHKITHIYTDYLGFWSSGHGNLNPVQPDYSHNLLGFRYNGQTFSTGVNDMLLTSYGVSFEAMTYQSLPVVDMDIPRGGDRYAQFGQMQDGINNAANGSNLFPYSPTFSLSDMLTDGINGLDISTGVTNIKKKDGALIQMEYPFNEIVGPNEIGDGVPDILVSQIAQPNAIIDKIWLEDKDGNQVGNIIDIIQTDLDHLGVSRNDFFHPNGESAANTFTNSTREIRISAFEASEFGLDENNLDLPRKLVYRMGGSSDPAFIAFNMDLFKILVANNDQAAIQPLKDQENKAFIDVLANDRIPEGENVDAITDVEYYAPSHGSLSFPEDASGVEYTPNEGFIGVDTFRYRVCLDNGNCDFATVFVVVGEADLAVTKGFKEMEHAGAGVGENLVFSIKVVNNGPNQAPNVRLIDQLPSGYELVRVLRVSRGSYSSQTGYWSLGNLALDESAYLEIEAKLKSEGQYTNTAEVSSAMYDSDLENNTSSITPDAFPSFSMSASCEGDWYKSVHLRLEGVGPWQLEYTLADGQPQNLEISESDYELKLKSGGNFQVRSITDDHGRKVTYPEQPSPSTMVRVTACKLMVNPALPSRVGQ